MMTTAQYIGSHLFLIQLKHIVLSNPYNRQKSLRIHEFYWDAYRFELLRSFLGSCPILGGRDEESLCVTS